MLGVGYQRWSNVETGHPLGIELALILVIRVPGLTLDWLYLGKAGGLTIEFANSLGVFAVPPSYKMD